MYRIYTYCCTCTYKQILDVLAAVKKMLVSYLQMHVYSVFELHVHPGSVQVAKTIFPMFW